MQDYLLESLKLQRIDFFIKLVAASECSEEEKRLAIQWVSELTQLVFPCRVLGIKTHLYSIIIHATLRRLSFYDVMHHKYFCQLRSIVF